ncbi:MAG: DUF1579 family protein [Planctomycetota bacterium]
MNLRDAVLRPALVLAFLLPAVGVRAQDPQGAPPQPEPGGAAPAPAPTRAPGDLDALQLAQAMATTMRLAQPGEPHRRLAGLAGAFDVEMTLQAPGLEAQTTRGTARAAAVLGGRYVVVNLTARIGGVLFEGLYVFGFDNMHSLYTCSWRDSMSTWAVDCSGPPPKAPDASELVLGGTLVDAASTTGRPFELHLEFTADGFAVSVHDTIGAQKVEVMRQRFTRRDEDAAGAAEPGGRDK